MREAVGAWRSLVARLLWEQEVGGSNPSAPTSDPGSRPERQVTDRTEYMRDSLAPNGLSVACRIIGFRSRSPGSCRMKLTSDVASLRPRCGAVVQRSRLKCRSSCAAAQFQEAATCPESRGTRPPRRSTHSLRDWRIGPDRTRKASSQDCRHSPFAPAGQRAWLGSSRRFRVKIPLKFRIRYR